MSNVVPMVTKHDWKWHRDRIVAAWGKHVESIIKVGQCLIDAKAELEHGSFLPMVRTELPFGSNAAQRLMAVAAHPILSNAAHAPLLPASWATLYELTKLPHDRLLTGLKDGTINPKVTRKELLLMVPRPKKEKAKSTTKIDKPTAKSATTTETLGELRERAIVLARGLSREQRIREIDHYIKGFGLNVRDWAAGSIAISKHRRSKKDV